MKTPLLLIIVGLLLGCGDPLAVPPSGGGPRIPPEGETANSPGGGAMAPGGWAGVDESVVERFAEEAGRPAGDPYINTDQGDLLLFVFLVAGACGGFVAGYAFRMLFSENASSSAP